MIFIILLKLSFTLLSPQPKGNISYLLTPLSKLFLLPAASGNVSSSDTSLSWLSFSRSASTPAEQNKRYKINIYENINKHGNCYSASIRNARNSSEQHVSILGVAPGGGKEKTMVTPVIKGFLPQLTRACRKFPSFVQ